MKMKRQLALFVIAALLVGLLPMENAMVSKASAVSASAAEGTARAGYGLNNPVTDATILQKIGILFGKLDPEIQSRY